MHLKTPLIAAGLLGALSSACLALTLVVPGDANIFGSGAGTPPGGGSLPPVISFSSGSGLVLSFSSVTGSVTSGGFSFGPDGEGSSTFGTDMDAFQGLSGARADTSFLLFGVFLDDSIPNGAPPATLDFRASGLTPDFTTVAPGIGQIFYVGDGRTGTGGTGIVQNFQVPTTATRLFLGIADGQFDGVKLFGAPGNYADNGGSFTATLYLPEPSGIALIGLGLGIIIHRRTRTRPA